MNGRIRIAEAMGWKRRSGQKDNYWINPETQAQVWHTDIPDPENDANDDYAVLEWMREKGLTDNSNINWDDTWNALPEKGAYRIGDNFRAALEKFK